MLNSLIEAHVELEKELERAIGEDCATQVIEAIDGKMAKLEKSIRQSIPTNDDEARAKLKFFLKRILIVGGGIVSKKDISTIEELFDQVLASSGGYVQDNQQLASGSNT